MCDMTHSYHSEGVLICGMVSRHSDSVLTCDITPSVTSVRLGSLVMKPRDRNGF